MNDQTELLLRVARHLAKDNDIASCRAHAIVFAAILGKASIRRILRIHRDYIGPVK